MLYPNNSIEQLQSFLSDHPATKLLLTGQLGAGKTTLTKYRAQLHGIDPTDVTSPTYTYQQLYDDTILHVDMWRMETEDDLLTTGILSQIQDYDLIVIERPKWTHLYADESRVSRNCLYDGETRQIEVI